MNAEIAITQRAFMNLYEEKRAYLATKPMRFVEDLLHETEDLRRSNILSIRAAAEINHAACLKVLGRLE